MSFVVFWLSLFAVLLFLLGVVCKGMAAFFNGVVQAVVFIGSLLFLVGFAMGAIYIIYLLVTTVLTEGFMAAIGAIICLFLWIALFSALLGWLGKIVVFIITKIVTTLMNIVSKILEFFAGACERAYGYLLNVIIKQLEKV